MATPKGGIQVSASRVLCDHRDIRTSFAVALLALVAALLMSAATADAAPSQPRAVAPFRYEFRVVEFSMTATLTYSKTVATARYRLLQPSATRSVTYRGPHPPRNPDADHGTFAGPIVDVVAVATCTSPDPSCTKTVEYRPAGNKIVHVFVNLYPPFKALRSISAGVGRIPLATPLAGQDGGLPAYPPQPKCGRPDFGGWYQDAVAYASPAVLAKARATITGHHHETFTDPGIESIDWTLRVVLQRLSYHKLT